jgi:hypothetical protein
MWNGFPQNNGARVIRPTMRERLRRALKNIRSNARAVSDNANNSTHLDGLKTARIASMKTPREATRTLGRTPQNPADS